MHSRRLIILLHDASHYPIPLLERRAPTGLLHQGKGFGGITCRIIAVPEAREASHEELSLGWRKIGFPDLPAECYCAVGHIVIGINRSQGVEGLLQLFCGIFYGLSLLEVFFQHLEGFHCL